LPRRHSSRAAGALAAALVVGVLAPAEPQTASDRPLSIVPPGLNLTGSPEAFLTRSASAGASNSQSTTGLNRSRGRYSMVTWSGCRTPSPSS